MIDHETSILLGDLVMLLMAAVLVVLINKWGKGRARAKEKTALRLAKVRQAWLRPRFLR